MNGTFFDTLSVAENLQDAGIERKHAEAIAKAIKAGQGGPTTKSDFNQVRAEISQVRADMNSNFQRLEDKINNLRWTVIVVAGLVVALVKLIP